MKIVKPLRWPNGQRRQKPKQGAFQVNLAEAQEDLLNELRLLGTRYVVISRDRLGSDETAVAVYFDYDGDQMVFACDRWKKAAHNLRAIGKTIEALRGIARWGSTDMLKRSLHAFKTLPSTGVDWRSVFGFSNGASLSEVKVRYRKLASTTHPDHGGSQHEMVRLNKAWEAAQKELEND